ncbi:MAG: hypothetical protein HUK26_09410, partial [Duodenibacillus sp.]|nr:hypothetical protein [Duodenibacillus sp.]
KLDACIDWKAPVVWSGDFGKSIFAGSTLTAFALLASRPEGAPELVWREGGSDEGEADGGVGRRQAAAAFAEGEAEACVKLCAARRMAEAESPDECRGIGVAYNLAGPETNLLLVVERAEEDKADGMPRLDVVHQEPVARRFGADAGDVYCSCCMELTDEIPAFVCCEDPMPPRETPSWETPACARSRLLRKAMREGPGTGPLLMHESPCLVMPDPEEEAEMQRLAGLAAGCADPEAWLAAVMGGAGPADPDEMVLLLEYVIRNGPGFPQRDAWFEWIELLDAIARLARGMPTLSRLAGRVSRDPGLDARLESMAQALPDAGGLKARIAAAGTAAGRARLRLQLAMAVMPSWTPEAIRALPQRK